MIRLFTYDISKNKKFFIDKTYEDTIKTLKKYTYSNNIFVYDYMIVNHYYEEYELGQIAYWFGRQYRQIK